MQQPDFFCVRKLGKGFKSDTSKAKCLPWQGAMFKQQTRGSMPCMEPGHGWNPRDALQDCLNFPTHSWGQEGPIQDPAELRCTPQMLHVRASCLDAAWTPAAGLTRAWALPVACWVMSWALWHLWRECGCPVHGPRRVLWRDYPWPRKPTSPFPWGIQLWAACS